MPEGNVEVAQQAIGAFNDRDIEAFAALTTEDFEWAPSMLAVEGETFRGREGIDTYFGRLEEAWERFRIHPDRFRDDEPQVVVMLGRLEGLGKSSGVPVDSSLGMVFDLRDVAIARIRGFLDHGEALRAAGLPD
jgi:ketosteroid isomerase-like protein